jgi:hypothetical protein
MKTVEELLTACRTRPRLVAKFLTAHLEDDESAILVEFLQAEASIMAEFREMLAEGRKVHRTRKTARPKSARFVDSVDCWLSKRNRAA